MVHDVCGSTLDAVDRPAHEHRPVRMTGRDRTMATSAGLVKYLLEQAAAAGHVTARKMFGEYGLYCDGTLVGLICDDRLFIKPTKAGLTLIGTPVEAPPYPGAKPRWLVAEDRWDDRAWLCRLVKATADSLPPPRTRKGGGGA